MFCCWGDPRGYIPPRPAGGGIGRPPRGFIARVCCPPILCPMGAPMGCLEEPPMGWLLDSPPRLEEDVDEPRPLIISKVSAVKFKPFAVEAAPDTAEDPLFEADELGLRGRGGAGVGARPNCGGNWFDGGWVNPGCFGSGELGAVYWLEGGGGARFGAESDFPLVVVCCGRDSRPKRSTEEEGCAIPCGHKSINTE